jgi:hypothetical protein
MVQIGWMRLIVATCIALCVSSFGSHITVSGQVLAAADTPTTGDEKGKGDDKKKQKTPEEVMQARFPQPALVGHLIGLPVLDYGDSTIGYVQQVVRTSEGKIRLIVPYGKRFGWARDWWPFNIGRRLVAVPIETVAILALQIDALDMTRDDFDKASTWIAEHDQVLPPYESVQIALARR